MVYIAESKSLRKSINLPVTNYKLIFITLTLSAAQIHSDNTIKLKLLQPFLRILRNRWKVKNYLWKAEAQDNGNIHFHITTDQFINWKALREVWNTLQENLNYVSRSKIEDPNSTDIHAVYRLNNPAAYICGYIGKKDLYKKELKHQVWEEHYYKNLLQITACDIKTKQVIGIKRPIEGKIYDCNNELKRIKAVWQGERIFADEVEQELLAGQKQLKENFFTVTFIRNLKEGKAPFLKYLLDSGIRYAYREQSTKKEHQNFATWLNHEEWQKEISEHNQRNVAGSS